MSNPSPAPDAPNAAVHVHFLLDRSGSMASIAQDVIGGFNRFLQEQQARPGECRMTLVQFDSQSPFELLADAREVRDVLPLDDHRYQPRGGTPLLDALGGLLDQAERRTRGRDEDPVVVVFTDGQENSSHKGSRTLLFERIERLTADGWAFVFLGANQDAYAEAGHLGFQPGSTSGWQAHRFGSAAAFDSLGRTLTSYRGKPRHERAAQHADFFEGVKEAEAVPPSPPPTPRSPGR